ncbi:hypothetical protein JVT61DRAFT_6116 [Boletus reticuloceps]|uniref:Uncharacterized protein n=1 Tax=Boletus reticuloceps TaxID=495285 RepID=A0A8I2YLN9_9AGAM|nr:hypothetical protein JVT61DRAFT_6116 [Boletus reticuloceps]
MVISIPSCRHTFTVETLDGHCGMSEFHSCGANGKWLGLLSPTGYRRPPTCPTCRSEITAPRYGRVFKRANLDILEPNVAAQMSLSLGIVQTSLESVSISSKKDELLNAAATIDLRFKDKTEEKKRMSQNRTRTKTLNSTKDAPISEREINPADRPHKWPRRAQHIRRRGKLRCRACMMAKSVRLSVILLHLPETP